MGTPESSGLRGSPPAAHGKVPGKRERGSAPRIPSGWPLLAVLAVQALLSLRLVRADTAFEVEATYLWAGHLEWAHLSQR